ncbi:MAG: galactose-binding domain-containing protein [Aggregatilineales bacterium]
MNAAASQSSSLAGYSTTGPCSAVDGNTDGNFYDGSVTHTNADLNAWWQVDLLGDYPISSINIWNRTDCCSSRLSNFYIFVSDTPFISTDLTTTLNQGGVYSYYIGTTAGSPTNQPINRTGRYVRIQLAGTNYLSLAEVQVLYGPFVMVYHDSLGGLSVVAADGSNKHQIRATGNKPVWANYGDRLAFIDNDSHGLPQVFVMNASGDYVVQITQTPNGTCAIPSWSSDDSQIAYGVSVPVSGSPNRCDLYVVPVNGSNAPAQTLPNIHAFTWLPNGAFNFAQPNGSSPDQLGMAQIPPSTGGSSVASVISTQAMPAAIPQTCGTVTNVQIANDGTAVAYQTACTDATTKYFITDLRSGTTQTSVTPLVVVWMPNHGLIYGTSGQLFYAADVTNIGTAAAVPLTGLSQITGDLSTAQASAMIVQPNPVAGDKVLDPDFLSNGQLQKQITLSNGYDPATGENNYTAPDLAANKSTQAFASGSGHVDPATGQYKPGADTGTALPEYGLYGRFPVTDYADAVGGGYTLTNQAISLPGSGTPLDFRFTYPQNAWQSSQMLGHGWTHNFNIKLILACETSYYSQFEVPIKGRIVFQESNGAHQTFMDNLYGQSSPATVTNARFTPDSAGLFASLERVRVDNSTTPPTVYPTDNTTEGNNCSDTGRVYKVTLADNTVYTFDWLGRLTTIDHVHQSSGDWHPLKLSYYGSSQDAGLPSGYMCGGAVPATGGLGELVRVADGSNNSLDFCYLNGSNRISEVHDKRGGSYQNPKAPAIQFGYDGNPNISTSVDWRGKTWTYSYGYQAYDPNTHGPQNIPFVLTSVTGPNNVALAVQYNINVKNKDCSNNVPAAVCLTLAKRISGGLVNGQIVGTTEAFDNSQQNVSTVTTGTGTATGIATGTGAVITATVTTGTVNYTGAPNMSAAIRVNTGDSAPDEYQTTFSYSSQQGTVTGINATGAAIASQYGADQFDPYDNVIHTQSGQNIVIYTYSTVVFWDFGTRHGL